MKKYSNFFLLTFFCLVKPSIILSHITRPHVFRNVIKLLKSIMDSSDDFESDPFNAKPLKRIRTKGPQSPSQKKKLKSAASRNKENKSRNPRKVFKPRASVVTNVTTNVTTKQAQKVQTSQCRTTQTQNLCSGQTFNKGK